MPLQTLLKGGKTKCNGGERYREKEQTEREKERFPTINWLAHPALHGDAWCGRQTTLSSTEIRRSGRAAARLGLLTLIRFTPTTGTLTARL